MVIEAEGLTKRYGHILAVDHISFGVLKGEVFGFLGPNGAGKTTTIRMLTGLTKPTEGTARVMGFDIIRESKKAKKRIGLVPEVSNVYEELSVWDNLMFAGEIYGVPSVERKQKGRELLEMFELYYRRRDKAGKLSKGLKRRVAIAMALMNEPELLFLDEPTSGLDVPSARMIRNFIRSLNREGVTIFLATHNMEEANSLCERIAIMKQGRIVAVDSPEKLKNTIESSKSIVVSFSRLSRELKGKLEKLQGVERVVVEGDKFRLYTADPPTVLEGVFMLAQREGLRIISVNTMAPSLEDVFMMLIKR
ncbi:MAG: ATP-binding protein [Thermoplasmata archaeon]|nr:MAG: ATP-binding protein [Thermoplasmata archaeon]